MRDKTAASLAKSILTVTEDPSVIDTLLRWVSNTVNYSNGRRAILGSPSPAGVEALLRNKAHHQIIEFAVQHITDPDALMDLAKDKRKGVRRAVAANPNAHPACRDFLADWAYSGDLDSPVIHILAREAPLLEELTRHERIRDRPDPKDYPWSQVAARVRESDDPEIWTAAINCGPPMIYQLAGRLSEGAFGFHLADILTTLASDAERAHVLRGLWSGPDGTIDGALAAEIRFFAQEQLLSISDSRRGAAVTAAAAAVWADSPDRHLRAAAATAEGLDRWTIDALIAAGGYDAVATAATSNILSTAQILAVLGGLRHNDTDVRGYLKNARANSVLTSILHHTPNIPTDLRLKMLRRSNWSLVKDWLGGRTVNNPRPGEITALFENPGVSMQAPNNLDHQMSLSVITEECFSHGGSSSNKQTVSVVHSALLTGGLNGWIGELLDLLPGILEHLGPVDIWSSRPERERGQELYIEWVSRHLIRQLGNDAEAYEMLMRMCGTWTGSTRELVETVSIAAGVELNDEPTEADDVGDVDEEPAPDEGSAEPDTNVSDEVPDAERTPAGYGIQMALAV